MAQATYTQRVRWRPRLLCSRTLLPACRQSATNRPASQRSAGRGVAFFGDSQPEIGLGNGPLKRGGGTRAQVNHGRDPGLLGELSPSPGDVVAASGEDPVCPPTSRRPPLVWPASPRTRGHQGEPGTQVFGMIVKSYSSNSVEK